MNYELQITNYKLVMLLIGLCLFMFTGCTPVCPSIPTCETNITSSQAPQNLGTIKGQVTTEGIKTQSLHTMADPVAGATVFLENTNIKTTTDVNGNFVLENIPAGNYVIIAEKTDTGGQKFSLRQQVSVKVGETVDTKSLLIKKTGIIYGTAILKDKTDFTGIEVYIAGSDFETQTDAKGNFIITMQEGTYDLMVSYPGYKTAKIEMVKVKSADATQTTKIELTPDITSPKLPLAQGIPKSSNPLQNIGFIKGQIIVKESDLNISGNPISGARVFLENTDYNTTTDENGNFGLTAVKQGKYTIIGEKINSDGQKFKISDSVLVAVSDFTADFIDIKGKLTNESIRTIVDGPVRGASVSIENTDLMVTTDWNGNFLLSVPAGNYTLRAGGGKILVSVKEGEILDLKTLNLKGTGIIYGTAILNDKTEHTGIDIYIPDTVYHAKTDEKGDFSLINVPEGTYDVVASYPGYYTVKVSGVNVKIGESATTSQLKLMPENATDGVIQGTVVWDVNNKIESVNDATVSLDKLDEEVTGATVSLENTTLQTITDANGNFTLIGVPAGSYPIIAEKTKLQTTTDTSGNFTLSGIPAGNYTILAEKTDTNGQKFSLRQQLSVKAGETVDLKSLLIKKTGIIYGTAILKDKTDHTGIDVYLADSGFGAKTDEKGDFAIINVPEGTYDVVASYAGYKTVKVSNIKIESGGTATAGKIELEKDAP